MFVTASDGPRQGCSMSKQEGMPSLFRYLAFLVIGMLIGFLVSYTHLIQHRIVFQAHATARITAHRQRSAFLADPQVEAADLSAAAARPASSCWQCIKPEWRSHFVFGTATGRLHACPDSSSWPPGLWLGTQSTAVTLAERPAGALDAATLPQQQQPTLATPGEPAALPYTLAAQQTIWANQHPYDCRTAKFVVFTAGHSGIGSVLHTEAAAMAGALETGRVFLERPGNFLTATRYCGDMTTLDSCYFLPLSNCTLELAGISAKEVADAPRVSTSTDLRSYKASDPASPKVIKLEGLAISAVRTLVPAAFTEQLRTSGIPAERQYWWWRAQAVAYMVRPNRQTLAEIANRRQTKLRGRSLEAGCISLYVRHGDKEVEAKVWEDAAYDAALHNIRGIDSSLTRQVFLSTEDPATVDYFTRPGGSWRTSFLDMKRKPDRSKSNLQYMAEHGYDEEMLDVLATLDLSLHCDGFVASFYSNWARLIEELKATVRCKAHRVFMDVNMDLMHDEKAGGGLDLNW